jgi:hypothetical protein
MKNTADVEVSSRDISKIPPRHLSFCKNDLPMRNNADMVVSSRDISIIPPKLSHFFLKMT